jgi:aldehyde dehydrogenase (NAD+)/betaine-aldehyde dehydrogenase
VLRIPSIIDGKELDGPEFMAVIDPSTGQQWAQATRCGPGEVDLAVEAARHAFDTTWVDTPASERGRLMRRLADLVRRDGERLAELETRDVGKPIRQARADVTAVARYFDYYGSIVEALDGDTLQTSPSVLAFTIREPFGVTGHITPWNYPLQMTARTVAPSLAAGNCCVHKPAEDTPVTAVEIARLALEAGFPPGVYNVVNGPGSTVGDAITRHDGIDHVSFTGSRPVGELVAINAARHVIPAVLELGGKSPNIVFADADLEVAIPLIVNAITQNAGQTCSAGSRLLVEESIHEELVNRLAEAFEKVDIGPASTDPTLGPLISEQQRERVLGYVAWAKEHASVRFGGEALNGGELGNGYYIQPTLIDNVDPTSRLAQEEIFGPVLVVTPFKDADEAVALANGTDYGLVAGVWTTNVSTAHRMIRDVVSGQVFVNTYGASGGVELPFGGFKRSGHGREKGAEGLRGFGQIKTAVVAL